MLITMRSLTLYVFITLISSFLFSQGVSKPPLAPPESTVKEYCQLDSAGARTRGETASKTNHLILWEMEPGWDTVDVVRNFKVVSSHTNGNHAVVVVEYDSLGEIAGWEFVPKSKIERIEFTLELGNKEFVWKNNEPVLVRSTRRWRITKPVIEPHISLQYSIEHVYWLIRTQHDPERQLTEVLTQLKAIQRQGVRKQ